MTASGLSDSGQLGGLPAGVAGAQVYGLPAWGAAERAAMQAQATAGAQRAGS